MFISGMGFLTDAYDLLIIGIVMEMLKQQRHISPVAEGLVTSTALLAAALGAVLFGHMAEMVGRKHIYGFEVLVPEAGAVASAFSPHLVADRVNLPNQWPASLMRDAALQWWKTAKISRRVSETLTMRTIIDTSAIEFEVLQ